MVFLWLVHKLWTCSRRSWRAGTCTFLSASEYFLFICCSSELRCAWTCCLHSSACIADIPSVSADPLWLTDIAFLSICQILMNGVLANDSPMCSHTAVKKQSVLLFLVPDWCCCWSKWKCHPSRCLCVWRTWRWVRLLVFRRSWSPLWESTALPSVLLFSSEAWESFGRNPKDFSRMVKKKVKSKAGVVCTALPVQE